MTSISCSIYPFCAGSKKAQDALARWGEIDLELSSKHQRCHKSNCLACVSQSPVTFHYFYRRGDEMEKIEVNKQQCKLESLEGESEAT